MNEKRPVVSRPPSTTRRSRRIHPGKVNARPTPLQVSIVAVARDLEQARDTLGTDAYPIFLDICRRRVGRELDRIACGDEIRAARRLA